MSHKPRYVLLHFLTLFAVLFSGLGTAITPAQAAPLMQSSGGWTAYNDAAGTTGGNTTSYTITSGNTTGLLKDYASGDNTGVTVTFTSSGNPTVQTMSGYSGGDTAVGTDAYNTFHGFADMAGVIQYGDSGWWVDVTFSGLDPAKTYTFATSANRDDDGYSNRIARFTIRDVDTAVNASTAGATVKTTNFTDDTTAFSTGYNTVNGYVARWTGIHPGSDGDFTVRAEADTSERRAYAFSVFMLQEEAAAGPTITVSGVPLDPFSSAPGVPSAEQSYTVTGSSLTNSISVAAPEGFEVSATSGSGFGPTAILPPAGGTVYVRFNRAELGTSAGDIAHNSAGAATRTVAVSGTATAPLTSWIAYNDLAWASGQPETNITKYTIPDEGTSSGVLVDYATGQDTPASVAITASGDPRIQTGTWGGAETNAGTDAYDTFHGFADMAGVIQYGDSGWYVDLEITGLDPASTYTFATSANRDGSDYTGDDARISRFTISGVDAAINASTSGVTVKDAPQGHSVAFNTGYNTVNGYVARWSGINPGADGTFKVRVEADADYQAYGPSVFMLGLEGEAVTYMLEAGNDGNGVVNLSPAGGVYASGTTVTLTPAPEAGFAFSHWSGPAAGDIQEAGGTYTILMDSDKSVTANFMVSLCTDVSLVAAADTHMRSGNTRGSYNYGGSPTLRVNPYYQQGSDDGQLTGALMRWDVSEVVIPDGATVEGASLTFHVTDGSNNAYSLYNMRRAWVEGTNSGATGTGASWNYYGAGTGSWGTTGAQNTSSDRYDVNLWHATASDFNKTGKVTFNLNADGLEVVRGWLSGGDNHGLTIQNYSGSAVDIWETASKEASDEAQRPRLNITYCVAPTDPTIFASGVLVPFTSTAGVPSAVQSYTVTGLNLTEALVITAPSDFQVSLAADSGFGPSLSLTPNGEGEVQPTTIYVRFLRSTVGASSGNITHSSEDATPVAKPVSGAAASNPPTASLVQPSNYATNVSTSPALEALVSDPDGDTLTVDFFGRVAGETAGDGEDFTLVVFPDTQNAAQSYPAVFNAMSQYIVDNKDDLNVAFVTHVGDIVQTANNQTEWQRADTAMGILDTAGIPYSVGPGNHDLPIYSSPSRYNDYFGVDRFQDKPWYGGHYGDDNYNNYSLFSASGMDFILINLQYNSTSAHLDWADGLLKAHPDRHGIVVQHNILNTDNSWQNQAPFTALKDNPNLFLMLCGHMHTGIDGAAYRAEAGDAGQTIHIMLADYQDFPNGGSGYLRILRFSPADDKIYATTYSPTVPGFITTYPDQMEMDYAMSGTGGAAFELIGTVTGQASGSTVPMAWPGRAPDTEYEWYAAAHDGTSGTDSDVWSFTTWQSPPPTCYALTLDHTGNGTTPTATPASSTGCPASEYHAGEAVTLSGATPDTGWEISGWTGTSNNASTAATNSLIMPASAHTAVVNYALKSFTLKYSAGAGGSLTGNTNQTVLYGESGTAVTAVPATGYHFVQWSDGSTANPRTDTSVTANVDVTATFATAPPTCYALTLSHAGEGSDPVAIPANSDGCPTGQYIAGHIPTLTASPSAGWTVGSWTGTLNDASTATTNQVEMPAAAHMAGVNYVQIMHNLTVAVDPAGGGTTTPAAGVHSYTEGSVVDVTAAPAAGYLFDHWSGDCTGSGACQVTMTADKTVTAHFTVIPPTCYALTLTHTGEGSDPVASPANSTGCDEGQYVAGEAISLSGATPASGWEIGGWTGTSNNASTAATNSLTMPASGHTAGVTYTEIVVSPTCYALTLTHAGQGSDPTASPANSEGCAAGQYVAGEAISLSGATPASGWQIGGWTGTSNNASKAATNSLTMPASAHTAGVTYTETAEPTEDDLFIYVPVILR